MPFINKECHNCGKSDKPVYERYQCVSGSVMKFKIEEIDKKFFSIKPANMEYWCIDCYRIENVKMEIL